MRNTFPLNGNDESIGISKDKENLVHDRHSIAQ